MVRNGSRGRKKVEAMREEEGERRKVGKCTREGRKSKKKRGMIENCNK